MHEVAGVHQELFAENSDLYGEDLRIKIERCLEVTDAQAETAARHRAAYRETVEATLVGIDLIVTPTLPCVAPRIGAGGIGDLELRETLIRMTFPFNVLGWPTPLPCGPARWAPASVQLAGRPEPTPRPRAGRLLGCSRQGARQLGAQRQVTTCYKRHERPTQQSDFAHGPLVALVTWACGQDVAHRLG
jgi:hypothetical protein